MVIGPKSHLTKDGKSDYNSANNNEWRWSRSLPGGIFPLYSPPEIEGTHKSLRAFFTPPLLSATRPVQVADLSGQSYDL